MTRALLWDIDGTLIDTTDLIVSSLDSVFQRFLGRSLPYKQLRALIGIPLREQVTALGDPRAHGVDPRHMEQEFVRIYESGKHLERVITPAVEALVCASREGAPTALVTSKNRQEIANTLPRLNVAPYVQVIVCADDVRRTKPDPECVRLALDRLGVDARDALYIGDTVHDMRAAAGAGVPRCAVLWGASSREELEAEHPEYVCEKPEDLSGLLRSL